MNATASTGGRTGGAGRGGRAAAAVAAAVLAVLCAGGAVAVPAAAAVRTDAMTIDGGSWRQTEPAADFPTVRRGHARGTMLAV